MRQKFQEYPNTFTVSLAVSGAGDTATGTILDDEAPTVTVGDVSAGSSDLAPAGTWPGRSRRCCH